MRSSNASAVTTLLGAAPVDVSLASASAPSTRAEFAAATAPASSSVLSLRIPALALLPILGGLLVVVVLLISGGGPPV